jgi:hypothetical protein
MPCPTGQIQIGINPTTLQPLCVDPSAINTGQSGSVQTGATVNTNGNWWSQVLNSIPGVLGGVADVIGSSKGNKPGDNITIVQNPERPEENSNPFPWGWVIGVIVVTAIIVMIYLKRKK